MKWPCDHGEPYFFSLLVKIQTTPTASEEWTKKDGLLEQDMHAPPPEGKKISR
jgi:hypothetical protein